MTRLALAGLGLLLASEASAQEYREFTLTDGRSFVAEVLATEGTGMRVRVPQGETFVLFGELADMVAVDEGAYADQAPWYLYLASSASYRAGFAASFRAIPGVDVLGPDTPGPLDEATSAAMRACDVDLACLVDTAPATPWMWVVVATFDSGDAVYEAVPTSGGQPSVTRAPRVDLDAVNAAAWAAVGVEPFEAPPPEVVEITPEPEPEPAPPAPRPAMTRQRVWTLSFVPLPGYASLAQGDAQGFGLAMATVVPVTALWVGATGKSAQSPATHVALGLAGYYVATVAANQVFGLRTFNRQTTVALGVSPTPQGGTAVRLTVVR